jgi:hypothetical protein
MSEAVKAPEKMPVVEKYVVRSDLVWKHKKGSVVKGDIANFPIGTDFDKLIMDRAIRPAMPSEYDMTVVDVDANLKAGISLTEQINDAQATAARFQRENEELKRKTEELLRIKTRDQDPTYEQRSLDAVKKYEDVIQTLNLANKQQAGELEQLRRMLNDKTNGKQAK